MSFKFVVEICLHYTQPMSYVKQLMQIAGELNLNFSEEAVQAMLALLEEDVAPDNLVKILEEIKTELKSQECN